VPTIARAHVSRCTARHARLINGEPRGQCDRIRGVVWGVSDQRKGRGLPAGTHYAAVADIFYCVRRAEKKRSQVETHRGELCINRFRWCSRSYALPLPGERQFIRTRGPRRHRGVIYLWPCPRKKAGRSPWLSYALADGSAARTGAEIRRVPPRSAAAITGRTSSRRSRGSHRDGDCGFSPVRDIQRGRIASASIENVL